MCRAQGQLREWDRSIRWTRPEQMHLTLKFLGEVEDRLLPKVCDAVIAAADAYAAFKFEVAGVGCFPERGPVRVLWAGVTMTDPTLPACVERLERDLAALGFEPERRRFSPHLTIGRVKDRAKAPGLRERIAGVRLDPLTQPVEELVLFESRLSPQGPRYTAACRRRLTG